VASKVDLPIRAGLPFARRIRVVGGRATWPTLDSFEVRADVRSGASSSSPLRYDLRQHMAVAYDGDDIVIDLSMTGAQTRQAKGGNYDVLVSDAGAEDARAIVAVEGQVTVTPVVSGA
jgi:hypothetical protein